MLTSVTIRMEDAGWIKRKLFHYFIGVAPEDRRGILEGRPVPLAGRLAYALGDLLIYGPLKNVLGFSNIRVAYTAGEAIGQDLFSFFRSLGINLKQLYGQTEAFLYVTAQKDGAVRSDTVGPAGAQCRYPHLGCGEVLVPLAGHVCGVFQAGRNDRRNADARRLRQDRRCRFLRGGRAAEDHRPRQGCRQLTNGALFAPKYIENTLKFFPDIKEAVAFGDGRDCCRRLPQHRSPGGRQLGRAQQHRLRVLPGARRPS